MDGWPIARVPQVMRFCPDDEVLVLEIFKQLGTGNTIKDVPVRFRAKDGRIVPLLIDSNVNYSAAGEFNHTRCFIRDDTGRKVAEAQTEALLVEALRTRKLFDAFVSRTLHLIRTPCHVLLSHLQELNEPNAEKHLGSRRESASTAVESSSAAVDSSSAVVDSSAAVAGIGSRRGSAGSVGGQGAELLNEATALVTRIVSMTHDFSDAIKFEQGAEIVVRRAPADLRTLGKRALAEALPSVGDEVSLVFEFHAGGSSVHTDPAVLRRVLGHLLRNAAQATSEGKITLRITHKPRAVTIAVVDTGKGLEPGDANVFGRYRQPRESAASIKGMAAANRSNLESDLSLSSGREGLGVGLSLSYSLAQALGAELRYSSVPGNTRFWFDLPREPSEEGPREGAEVVEFDDELMLSRRVTREGSPMLSHDWTAKPECSPLESVAACALLGPAAAAVAAKGIFEAKRMPHVLIVEDSPFCSAVLESKLEYFGCTTELAEDGVQAVAKLRAAMPGQYSLVLMDIRMPNMDGYTATRIAKTELNCTVPIVAVSAEDDVKADLFDAYAPKPLTTDNLKELLHTHSGLAREPPPADAADA
jgi:signal transduction histidine kinase/CheY-like chemotaxis protein